MKQFQSAGRFVFVLLLIVSCLSCSLGTEAIPTVPGRPATVATATATGTRLAASPSPLPALPTVQSSDIPIPLPASPTAQSSDTPIPLPTPTVPPPTDLPTPCGQPTGWPAYTVQAGDTLFGIAYNTGISLDQLKLANCLPGDTIYIGQVLFVPFIPYIPPASPTISLGPTIPVPAVPTITVEPGTPPQPPPPSPTGGLPVTPGPTVRVPRLTPAPRSGPRGTVFTISLENFQANENITIQVTDQTTNQVVFTQSVTTDQSGEAIGQFDSHAAQSLGRYILVAFRGAEPVAFEQIEITQ